MSARGGSPVGVLVAVVCTLTMNSSVAVAAFSQTYQSSGHLHLEVTGAAGLGMPAMGTLTLAAAPSGTVKKAYLYATQTNNTLGLSATFGVASLPSTPPYASEALLVTLSTYRWDVTSYIVPGVPSYSFSVFDGLGNPVAVAGVALAVVWEDAGENVRTVTIVDGVKQVGENGTETESMTFTSLPAGSTTVWIFTTDDDAATTDETVSYNSSTIGGPLVAQLGLNASVLKMTGTSLSGSNTLSITTISDHLTWVLGASAVEQQPVKTEQRSWGWLKSLFR